MPRTNYILNNIPFFVGQALYLDKVESVNTALEVMGGEVYRVGERDNLADSITMVAHIKSPPFRYFLLAYLQREQQRNPFRSAGILWFRRNYPYYARTI